MAFKAASSFILLSLMVFKIASATIHIYLQHQYENHGYHLNNHDDGCDNDLENQCELCENALFILNAEFSTAGETLFVSKIDVINYGQKLEKYHIFCLTIFTDNTLFGRPPPVLS